MSIVKNVPSWALRKTLYGAVVIVTGVLGWVGVLSQIQADQVADSLDQVLPILAGVAGSVTAFFKTTAASDGPTVVATDDQVSAAVTRILAEDDEGKATTGRHAADDSVTSYIASVRGEEES